MMCGGYTGAIDSLSTTSNQNIFHKNLQISPSMKNTINYMVIIQVLPLSSKPLGFFYTKMPDTFCCRSFVKCFVLVLTRKTLYFFLYVFRRATTKIHCFSSPEMKHILTNCDSSCLFLIPSFHSDSITSHLNNKCTRFTKCLIPCFFSFVFCRFIEL